LLYPDEGKSVEEEKKMQLTDFARKVPNEVWALFESMLPPVVWHGNGCPPDDNRACLHAVLYVVVTGIGWRMLPAGFPSYKTVQRRLRVWLALDVFWRAWHQVAQRYHTLDGINWDEVLLDGSKKPAKKGARKRVPAPWIAANAGQRSTSRVTPAPCR
jgi:transposase